MKNKLAWLVLGILFAGAGSAIYAQGEGHFWPCEAMGTGATCEEVWHLDGRSMEAMAVRPDGFLSIISRGAGIDPDSPLMLHVVRPQSGVLMEETALDVLPGDALPSRASIDAIGSQMAFVSPDFAIVVDRNGALIRDLGRGLPAFMGFDDQERLLIYQGTSNEVLPSAENVLAFDAKVSAEPVALGEVPGAMFSQGVNLAISPDGALVAQNMAEKESDGMAAVRLVRRDVPEAPGRLLSAELGDGCRYTFVELAFSPDGQQLAGTFDCIKRWGREGSALVIWNVADGTVAERIPTRHNWGRILWLDQATLMLTRYDVAAQRSGLFRVGLPR